MHRLGKAGQGLRAHMTGDTARVTTLAARWLQAGAVHTRVQPRDKAEWEKSASVPIVAVLMLLSQVRKEDRSLRPFL